MRIVLLFWYICLIVTTTGCKLMQDTQGQKLTLASTTVTTVNGVKVAASGVYRDGNGTVRVNLTVNRVPTIGQGVGDSLEINGEVWVVYELLPGKGNAKDQIVLRKN
jgi:hypothetical protein